MKSIRSLENLPENAVYDEMVSPVGKLIIIASEQGLHAVLWESYGKNAAIAKIIKTLNKSTSDKMIVKTKKQLAEYFQGKRKNFDVPLVFEGTDFQKQCWQQLQKIPYAQTMSYGEQAKNIGDENKARAVGMANGCNPISIIVPCHRVIGSSGALTGFGGGLANKQWLLEHEKKYGI